MNLFDAIIIAPFPVGFCCLSGSGAEHMAALSALLKSGGGIRLVMFSNNQVSEL